MTRIRKNFLPWMSAKFYHHLLYAANILCLNRRGKNTRQKTHDPALLQCVSYTYTRAYASRRTSIAFGQKQRNLLGFCCQHASNCYFSLNEWAIDCYSQHSEFHCVRKYFWRLFPTFHLPQWNFFRHQLPHCVSSINNCECMFVHPLICFCVKLL